MKCPNCNDKLNIENPWDDYISQGLISCPSCNTALRVNYGLWFDEDDFEYKDFRLQELSELSNHRINGE